MFIPYQGTFLNVYSAHDGECNEGHYVCWDSGLDLISSALSADDCGCFKDRFFDAFF